MRPATRNEEGEQKGDRTDEDGAEQRRSEAIYLEPDADAARERGSEEQHQGINDEDEKSQCEHDHAAREPAHNGTHEGIHQPKNEGRCEERNGPTPHLDPRYQPRCRCDRRSGGEPAEQEAHRDVETNSASLKKKLISRAAFSSESEA